MPHVTSLADLPADGLLTEAEVASYLRVSTASLKVKPLVEQHRRLAVVCPGCRASVAAPRSTGAASTPFGPRLHATAVYLKTF